MCLMETCGYPTRNICGKARRNHRHASHNTIGARHLIERGANMFPTYLCDDGFGNRRRRNTTSPQFIRCRATLSPPSRRRCRGSLPLRPRHSPRSLLTARPTPERFAWNGRASRCRAGLMAKLTTRQKRSLHQRHGAANWPACLTPKRTRAGRYPRHVAPGNRRPRRARPPPTAAI